MGDDHDGGGGTKVIKCSGLEKNKEKKPKKNSRQRYNWLGAFWFALKTP
jgi:hypothetical protein